MRPLLRRAPLAFGLFLLLATLSACSNLPYYWHSANGHLALLQAAKPIDDWREDPQTPPKLKARLGLVQQMRTFASAQLGLPDNASYRRYADVKRPFAVWNVVAAAPYSLSLERWCFALTGCIGYRGYFDEAQAQAFAAELRLTDLEVAVYGVPAYSTLGWMNWTGGDPVLNTFIGYTDGALAGLLFHELAHQVVYVQGDTPFNESFATAVEHLGAAQWLAAHGSDTARADYATHNARHAQFRALTQATRSRLAQLYAQTDTPQAERASAKATEMQNFRLAYAQLRSRWLQAQPAPSERALAGYDRWVEKANNASLATQAAYDAQVPQFEALFAQHAHGQQDLAAWQRFFAAVRRIAELPPAERAQALGTPLTTH